MLAFFALFEASHFRWSRGTWPRTASAVAGRTMFRLMDTGMISARHLPDHNLFLHAVHRHRACIALLSPSMSQRLGTSTSGANWRNGQLCILFRQRLKTTLHGMSAFWVGGRQRIRFRICRSDSQGRGQAFYKTTSFEHLYLTAWLSTVAGVVISRSPI